MTPQPAITPSAAVAEPGKSTRTRYCVSAAAMPWRISSASVGAVAEDVLVYQYRQTSGGEAAFARRWAPPMVIALSEALDSITARVGITPVNTSSGQQLQVEDYPLAAVREALVNALIHGDYRERRPVQVEHSPDELSVRSPGPLVAGITPENILTAGSRARFPLLAGACRALGLAEELGQGVDRMFREMARSGRSIPRVKVEHEGHDPSTVVSLSGGPPNIRVARFLSELPEAERNDTDALLIVLLLCQRRSAAARDVAPVIQRDPQATEAVLRRLSSGEAQLLEPTAGTVNRRHPNYRLRSAALVALGPAVIYHRRPATDIDRKVIEHVREYDTINSATVQRIFDIDVYQARDVLRDFVGREILVRISDQTRGPKVRYGPGPQFPPSGAVATPDSEDGNRSVGAPGANVDLVLADPLGLMRAGQIRPLGAGDAHGVTPEGLRVAEGRAGHPRHRERAVRGADRHRPEQRIDRRGRTGRGWGDGRRSGWPGIDGHAPGPAGQCHEPCHVLARPG